MPSRTTTDAVTTALNDVAFPADRDALVEAAQRNGADPETVAALRGIQPVRYRGVADVLASVPLADDDAGEDAAPVNPIAEELGTNRKQ